MGCKKSAPFQSCSHCASTIWMILQSHFQILAVHSCLDNSEFTMEISVAISALSAYFQILAVHSSLDNSEFTKEISVAISALKELFRQSLNSCNNLQNFPLSTAEQSSPAREQKLFQKLCLQYEEKSYLIHALQPSFHYTAHHHLCG